MNRNLVTDFENTPVSPQGELPKSTINADKLDRARFSQMQTEEIKKGNPLRIIICVIVVIVVGVVLALVVRDLVSRNESTTKNTETPVTPSVESDYTILKTPKADSIAQNLKTNSDYVDVNSLTIGSKAATDTLSLDGITYERFTTFARLKFDLSGTEVPRTNVNYDSLKNQVSVYIDGIKNISETLTKDIIIDDLIKEIRFDTVKNGHIIFLLEKSKYVVFGDNGDLVIDIKTNREIEKGETVPEVTTTETEEEETSTSVDPLDTTKPSSPHLTNEYSKNTQYIVTNLKTNTISHNIFYLDDYVSGYGFSFAQKNLKGDNSVPNAKAYYDTTTTKPVIVLEIENLSQELFNYNSFTSLTKAELKQKTGVETSEMNIEKIEVVSFKDGKATYKFHLEKKTDFKLWTQPTVDNTTQVISLDIKN